MVIAAAAIVGIATVVIVGALAAPHNGPAGLAAQPAPGVPGHVRKPVTARLLPRPLGYLGVFEPTSPRSYAGMEEFGKAAGRQPNLAMYYSGWPEKFQARFAEEAAKGGAWPVVVMNPTGIRLAAIADGSYDVYLERFADQVATFGKPVVISFAHEMNGDWYSWGYQTTKPATYVAAWRHIVTVFRAQGADNVTWLWAVNTPNYAPDRLCAWWPGNKYVTWIGLDSYYEFPGNTFAKLFASAVGQIRRCTSKPVLIAETAAGQLARPRSAVQNLFASIRKAGFLGFIWFDKDQFDGVYHQQWRLETDPPAVIAEFRREARSWRILHRAAR
jgi:hypothetical protein